MKPGLDREGAAARRGVSASSLSQAVRRLDERLGVRLLNRTTRSVTATEAGERLLARLTPTLAELALALDEVNSFRDSPSGTLRINMPTAAARLVRPGLIAPSLADGRLVEVLADWSTPFTGPRLYYPSRRHMPAPLRAFVDFLQARRAAGWVTEA